MTICRDEGRRRLLDLGKRGDRGDRLEAEHLSIGAVGRYIPGKGRRGGTAGSPAARTSVSVKVLVVRPCICSRPGVALLNVVTCSAESPETHHCQRTSSTFGFCARWSARL